MSSKYDFLIVGAGLFGSVFAQQCKENKKSCLVIDKKDHIAGNVYSKNIENIEVHMYGPHIFNTNNLDIWNYANRFSNFIQYFHRVKAKFNEKVYSMPINLQTIYEIYGIDDPQTAIKKIEKSKLKIENPKNLEDWCLATVGQELYEKFIKGYTQKQWGKPPKELPSSIIKRLPIRFNFDDRWHETKYSGIPENGYTKWVENILNDIKVELNTDFFEKSNWSKYAKTIIFTGPIDKLFNYCLGKLEYRSLKFETKIIPCNDYQGISQINYTDLKNDFTRTIEHKHFNYKTTEKTVVTWEYPDLNGDAPYYPINDEKNNNLHKKYVGLAAEQKIQGGGRLFDYKYYNMDAVIAAAVKKFKQLC